MANTIGLAAANLSQLAHNAAVLCAITCHDGHKVFQGHSRSPILARMRLIARECLRTNTKFYLAPFPVAAYWWNYGFRQRCCYETLSFEVNSELWTTLGSGLSYRKSACLSVCRLCATFVCLTRGVEAKLCTILLRRCVPWSSFNFRAKFYEVRPRGTSSGQGRPS